MTGSHSRSSSNSSSHARLSLLVHQVRVALRRAISASPRSLDHATKLVTRRWVSHFLLRGMDAESKCWIQVTLRIDWAAHALAIERGATTVTIGSSWIDSTAPEVTEAIDLFCSEVSEHGLTPLLAWQCSDNVDVKAARAELGSSPTPPIEWAGEVISLTQTVREIPEFQVRIEQVASSDDEEDD